MEIYVSQIANPEIRNYLKDRTDTESVAKGFVMLAQEAEQQEEWLKGVNLYGEVLKNKPTDPVVLYCGYCGRGYCLVRLRLFERAVRHLSLAIKTNPDYCHAYKLMGIASEGLGDYKVAAESYLSAILKKQDDKESWDYLMSLISNHPQVVEKIGKLPAAIRGARHLLERSGALPKAV